ncbi:MAG: succinate dehydrogenase assembly factor 2 [Pseudomonadota bacterium]
MKEPVPDPSEARGYREKRMKIRAWRRGTKEMDLILGGYADVHLGALSDDELAEFEQLLSENDNDLYGWVNGRGPYPAEFEPQLQRIRAYLAEKT